jgi:hypothetical protein
MRKSSMGIFGMGKLTCFMFHRIFWGYRWENQHVHGDIDGDIVKMRMGKSTSKGHSSKVLNGQYQRGILDKLQMGTIRGYSVHKPRNI